MPRWTPSFLQKIKDEALGRIEKRVRQELAPETYAPELGQSQWNQELEAPEDEEVSEGFADRIKNRVRDKLRTMGPVQRRLLDPNAPLDMPTIKYRIQYAAQNKLMILMSYNGQWRQVEPYSYRMSGTADPVSQAAYDAAVAKARSDPSTHVPPKPKREERFYGYCRIHNKIHSFKPNKIEGLLVTDIAYSPRWPVEF